MATMLGTTVVLKLNQGSNPPLGGFKRRGPFLGTFLGKQKGTKHLEEENFSRCNSF
jgi:hypothetical protein